METKEALPLMRCGHTAQGRDTTTHKPICIICFGLFPGATTPVNDPDLLGRVSKCICGRETPSKLELAFFRIGLPDGKDSYYCGCSGWD